MRKPNHRFRQLAVLGFCIALLPIMLRASDDPPVNSEECYNWWVDQFQTYNSNGKSFWGTIQSLMSALTDAEKCESCYDCLQDGEAMQQAYMDACPASLPTRGRRVELAMVTGGREQYDPWEIDVGFGPTRPLNYLARLRLSTDEKEIRLYVPSDQTQYIFHRVGNELTYRLDDRAIGLPAETSIRLNEAAAAVLHMPDGRSFGFETAPETHAGARLYRLAAMRERRGTSITVRHGDDNIVFSDASGNEYTIRFGLDRRILSIQAGARIWRYEYADGVVTEIAPDGAWVAIATDAGNRITSIVRNGGPKGGRKAMAIEYDLDGFMTAGVDGDVRFPVVEMNNRDGLLTRSFRLDGIVRRFTYANGGIVERAYGAAGEAVARRTPDQRLNVAWSADAIGREWRRDFDANGRIRRELDPMGNETKYEYDATGNIAAKITPEGAWRYEYDDRQNLVREIGPSGDIERYAYNAANDLIQHTDVLGNVTKYAYNDRGLMLSSIGPFGPGEPEPPARRFEYDDFGEISAEIDPFGQITRFEYDLAGNMTKRIDVLGQTTHYEYDGIGRRTKEIDALGGTTEWVYDERGLVVEVKGSTTAVAGPLAGRTTCGSCGGAAGAREKPGKYEYNAARLLTKYTDVAGNETAYEYNDLGQQIKIVDALGGTTSYVRDPAGNLLSFTDPAGNITRHEYDELGQRTATIDPSGATTKYAYDESGRLVEIVYPDGTRSHNEYDGRGRLIQRTNNGASTRFVHDAKGQVAREVDALGSESRFIRNANGQLIESVRDANGVGAVYRFRYDAAGRMTASIDPTGHETRLEYDALGHMTRKTAPSGAVTAIEYDALGRPVKVADPAGRVRTMEYAPGGDGLAATGIGGMATRWYEYDSLGRKTLSDGVAIPREIFQYDALGRLVERRVGDSVTKTEYDAAGRIVREVDSAGNETLHAYDAVGRRTATTAPTGMITRFEYNAVGKLVRVLSPGGGVRESVYDETGRLVETRGGSEGTMRYEYDVLGRRIVEIDALGARRSFLHDAFGRVLQRIDPDGRSVRYTYDAAGRRTSLTDPNGNRTVWEYNADGLAVSMTYPNGDRESYAYDPSGKMTEKRTPNGETIRYTYDEAGHLTKIEVEGGVAFVKDMDGQLLAEAKAAGLEVKDDDLPTRDFSVVYTRDPEGRIRTEVDPWTAMRYQYDENGRLAAAIDETRRFTLRYDYDHRGNRVRTSGDIPEAIRRDYDAAGRLTRVVAGNGENENAFEYRYDDAGRLAARRLSNGAETLYDYDAADRLARQATEKADLSFAYRRDDAGRLVGVRVNEALRHVYHYDAVGRLITDTEFAPAGDPAVESTFTYDAAGNRTGRRSFGAYENDGTGGDVLQDDAFPVPPAREEKSEFNNVNQLISRYDPDNMKAPDIFRYDRNGNMVARYRRDAAEAEPALVEWRTYDALNRLSGVFTANARERRIYRGAEFRQTLRIMETAGPDGKTTVKERVFYEDDEEILTISEAGERFRVFGNPGDLLAEAMRPTDGDALRIAYPLTDWRGSVVAYLDATGRRIAEFGYDAFGTIASQKGDARYAPSFTGRRHMVAGGLIDFRFRTYAPFLGQFSSRDPLSYEANPHGNLYQYCSADPVNRTDPYGLHDCQKAKKSRACGPGDGILEVLVPEYRFTAACKDHDDCFQNCDIPAQYTPDAWFDKCNSDFKNGMRDICIEDLAGNGLIARFRRWCCLRAADCYHFAVSSALGRMAFNNAQKKCD